MSATSDSATTFLPFALPDIDEGEIAAVAEVLRSGWLTTGSKARAFEEAFAAAVGARYGVAVNSCTAALHLALEAIGLRAGDEVITTPYTFAATAEVVRYFDAKPVFVDIDPVTLNIDASLVERAVTPRTRAVLPVDVGGLPCELDELMAITRHHNLILIEDAAHSFPAMYKGRHVGRIADVTCFSFYATKTITTGEGGMICTDDAGRAERCRRMALHGLSRSAWNRYQKGGAWRYEILAPGFKYNMTDVAAAMGLIQLRKAEAMRARREQIALAYDREFESLAATFELPARSTDSSHAWHLYPLRLLPGRLRIGRDDLIEKLADAGIGTSVHFIPLHLHPYYVEVYGYRPDDFPHATAQFEREISLPIYSRMSDDDVRRVVSAVKDVVRLHAV